MLNFFFSQNFKDNRVHHHYPPAPPILNTPAVHLQILKLHQNLILTEENLMAEFKVHQSRIKEDQTWLTSYQILRSSHLAWRLSQHWTSHTQVRKKTNRNKSVKGKKTIKEKRRSLTSTADVKKAGAQTLSERPGVVLEEVKKVVNSVKMPRKIKDTEKIPKLSLKAIQKKN